MALPRTCSTMARPACTSLEIPILPCWTMSPLGQESQKPQISKPSSLCPAHSRLPVGHPASLCQCQQKQELPSLSSKKLFNALVHHHPTNPAPELPHHQPLAAVSMVEASSHCCDSRCPRVNQRGYLLGTTETRW